MKVSEESRNSGNSTFSQMLREAGATDHWLSTSPSHHTWMRPAGHHALLNMVALGKCSRQVLEMGWSNTGWQQGQKHFTVCKGAQQGPSRTTRGQSQGWAGFGAVLLRSCSHLSSCSSSAPAAPCLPTPSCIAVLRQTKISNHPP